MVPASQAPRSEKWVWIEGYRSTPCSRGEAAVCTTRYDKWQSLVTKGSVWRDDYPARLDSYTTVQDAPETGPRHLAEAGSNLWRDSRPVSSRGY